MLFTIDINGQEVSAKRGETILTILNRNGIKVPTLCNLAGMTPTGSCRMCVVEVEGLPGLVPACSHPVEEWMKIRTHSPRVLKARKTIVELLLASHPDDCMYCDRSINCELQNLASELNIRNRKYFRKKEVIQIDKACPSIERDPARCILCGRCVRVCNSVIGVSAIDVVGRGSHSRIGTTYNKGLNTNGCIKCGQCIMVCPTGALVERSSMNAVMDALHNPELICAIQFSPTTPASIAEDFGLKPGKDVLNLMRSALRMMGFKYILDTSWAADLAIMEEATESVQRLRDHKNLPVMTASCPAWVKYIHEFRPNFIPNLLTTKSPQQIMGSLIKNYIVPDGNRVPSKIFTVSVMPCTAKKAEAEFDTDPRNKCHNVDAVLTTRELVRLIKLNGLDLGALEPDQTDTIHGIRSSAGKLFGVAGGPMEGMARTLNYFMTGQELSPIKINDLRGLKEVKEARLKSGKQFLNIVTVSGLSNAIKILNEIETGRDNIDLLEVMVCPFGCINGGGQRIGFEDKNLKSRMKAIYDVDDEEMIRVAHKNPNVNLVYDRLLGTPCSPQALELFHRPLETSEE